MDEKNKAKLLQLKKELPTKLQVIKKEMQTEFRTGNVIRRVQGRRNITR